MLAILTSYFKEAQERLVARLKDLLGVTLDSITHLTEFIAVHPEYNIDATKFSDDMRNKLDSDSSMTRLLFIRDALHSKIKALVKAFPAPPYRRMLRSALAHSATRCDPALNFSRYGQFDYILPYYLELPKWTDMVEATVLSVLEGSSGNALVVIASFAEAITADLTQTPSKSDLIVVYCGLVRFLFDEVYIRKPDLNGFAPGNVRFLTESAVFVGKSIHGLEIPEALKLKYQPDAPVSELFLQKQIEIFSGLDFVTNPIDLMFSVHQVHRFVRAVFNQPSFTTREEMFLVTALLSLQPPVNLVAIARFVTQWASMLLVPVIGQSQGLLIAGIEWLCPGTLTDN
jgi:hypothetical protein